MQELLPRGERGGQSVKGGEAGTGRFFASEKYRTHPLARRWRAEPPVFEPIKLGPSGPSALLLPSGIASAVIHISTAM